MTRATLADVERIRVNNWGAGGGFRIFCPGGCESARRWGKPLEHTYHGYTRNEALTQWRADHPRENGGNK